MKKIIYPILVALVLLVALFLRVYKLTSDPPSLNWDEVAIGYNAYSVLKTGRDEWGVKFPLNFESYSEYKLPAQIYASIPAIAILGLNDFSVRITPVIYGVLTVLICYFLTYAIFKKKSVALLTALLVATSPWHIQLTRASFESSFSVLWVVLGLWLLVLGFKKPVYWIISAIPFAISIYTYNSARVFAPLFLFAILLIYRKEFLKNFKYAIAAAVLLIVLMIPLVPIVFSGQAIARYKLVSITNDAGLIPRINENRGNSKLPQPLPRLIHNKVTYISLYFTENYLAHFTPAFLFISGAGHKQHNVQGMGELYYFQAPFVLLGLYFLFKKKVSFRWLLIVWLLIAFIPVATTDDSIPNALRTIIAEPFYELITAYGIYETYLWLKSKKKLSYVVWVLTIIVAAFNFYNYLHLFYDVYPYKYSEDWQYGYEQAVSYVGKNYNKYDLIVFTRTYGEPYMFTLFYLKYDPAKYQNSQNLDRFEANNWIWVLRFDKFYFPDLGDPGTHYQDVVKANPGKKILFVGKPGDFPAGTPVLEQINFLDGKGDFQIIEKL
ncbi:MAG TPA: glycosyltransferase family 39 protein [Candidatus Saccharimonadales bacterium]|nr:glycosyltransferase family 39 protein [Candidatus Saccharimonadales bacterium]